MDQGKQQQAENGAQQRPLCAQSPDHTARRRPTAFRKVSFARRRKAAPWLNANPDKQTSTITADKTREVTVAIAVPLIPQPSTKI